MTRHPPPLNPPSLSPHRSPSLALALAPSLPRLCDILHFLCMRMQRDGMEQAGLSPAELAAQLVAQGVWCTAGNHYAGFWNDHSDGLATNADGMCRLGFLHYNTEAEIDRVLQALENCRPGAART